MRVSVRRTVDGTHAGARRPPTLEHELCAGRAARRRAVRIESPMVGTFYRAPVPDAPPFVAEGDPVSAGQTLCILEAMKLMNEVKAELDGIVRRIHVAERGSGRVRPAAVRAGAGRRPAARRSDTVFRRVLVANRGRDRRPHHPRAAGARVEAVAVYSTADRDALHVRLADEAVCVGPPAAAESYLRIPSIVAAAVTTGCDAVHPGYGFLAENPAFAEACADNDLVFVGPPAEVMASMGDKIAARQAMRAAACPTVPGTDGATSSPRRAAPPTSSASRSCSRRRRRRRQGDAARAAAGRARGRLRRRRGGGGGGVRRRDPLHREGARPGAPRRDPGARATRTATC